MEDECGRILSENLQALMAKHTELTSDAKVAKKAGLDQKTVWRMIRMKSSPSLDNVHAVAVVFGLQCWQLLVPNLDPTNPPTSTMNQNEHDFYARLKTDFAKLKDNA